MSIDIGFNRYVGRDPQDFRNPQVETKLVHVFELSVCITGLFFLWYFEHGHTYHGCWRPGSLRRRGISTRSVDYVDYASSCLTCGRISNTCVMSVWRKDTNCRYNTMLPMKHVARKGLYSISHRLDLVWIASLTHGLFSRHQLFKGNAHSSNIITFCNKYEQLCLT